MKTALSVRGLLITRWDQTESPDWCEKWREIGRFYFGGFPLLLWQRRFVIYHAALSDSEKRLGLTSFLKKIEPARIRNYA
jgi:hypothetical protein